MARATISDLLIPRAGHVVTAKESAFVSWKSSSRFGVLDLDVVWAVYHTHGSEYGAAVVVVGARTSNVDLLTSFHTFYHCLKPMMDSRSRNWDLVSNLST